MRTQDPTAAPRPGTQPLHAAGRESILGLLPSVLLLSWLGGCSDPTTLVRGTGSLVQERRTLGPTKALEVRGRIDLTIEVRPSGAEAHPEGSFKDTIVWIEAPEDLIEYVETTFEGDQLLIAVREGFELDPVPVLEVRLPELERVAAAGSGTVRILGERAGRLPLLALSSVGAVDFAATAAVESLEIKQAGSGEMQLRGLHAHSLRHTAAGSGDAWVWVERDLWVTIAGSGDLHLSGNPTVREKTMAGSGDLIKLVRSAADADPRPRR